MSGNVKNPKKLNKEQLKKELMKHSIDLPASESVKQVYIDLYQEHILDLEDTELTKRGRGERADLNFSSDEEETVTVKARKSRQGSPRKKHINRVDMPAEIYPDIMQLTDDELRVELTKRGEDVGPITGTTRRVYQRKLQTLLSGPDEVEDPDVEEVEEYSDEDVPLEPEIIPEPQQPPKSSSISYMGRKSYRGGERESGDAGVTQLIHRTTREEVTVTQQQSEQKSAPKPATNTASKRGMSIWVQIAIFIVAALLVFLVIRNMEPKLAKPLIGEK